MLAQSSSTVQAVFVGCGCEVLGVVLNRVNLRSTDYHYSYRYYSTYYSKDDEKLGANFASSKPAPPAAAGIRTGKREEGNGPLLFP